MSNGGTAALALALGAGGGFLYWHLTRKDTKKTGGGGTSTPFATVGPPLAATMAPSPPKPVPVASSPPAEPPRVAAPCSLKLDDAGLTANGQRVAIPTAVAWCKSAGRAELALAPRAPAAIHAELAAALFNAQVPLITRMA